MPDRPRPPRKRPAPRRRRIPSAPRLAFALSLALLATAAHPAARAQGPAPAGAAARSRPPAGNPVAPGIFRLDGLDPALPTADLEPLRDVVGKATVVGLGESIHTSGGYHLMKARAFRFLVERMGFRALAIESSWSTADRAAHYVETCEGSADEAVRNLFEVWQSAEIRDLLQWMCDWNSAHPRRKDKVHLFGFDFQSQAAFDAENLFAFLARLGIGPGDPRVEAIGQCDGVAERFFPERPYPEERHRACSEGLAAVSDLLARNARTIARRTSRQDLGWAKVHLAGLSAWSDAVFYLADSHLTVAARDSGMAAVFRGIRDLRYPGARTAIWAANSHVIKDGPGSYDRLTMGTVLARDLKGAYAVVGLVGHEVEIDWRNVGCGPAEQHPDNSVERRLHELGESFLLVDLAIRGGAPPLVGEERQFVGDAEMVPGRHYDGLLYLDHSPKMHPLSWRPCG